MFIVNAGSVEKLWAEPVENMVFGCSLLLMVDRYQVVQLEEGECENNVQLVLVEVENIFTRGAFGKAFEAGNAHLIAMLRQSFA
ncbi:hypothetical protein GCM10011507_30310 [Edaphobacter acidisoli]|uniref:Uncharacterized protein n=1 Tax=Edaphobacter acidisoli TaxID=2040573 RepID=A0A916S140_9BACT|nr:hypothetical protein [Edaphobacter acidisoli]GGA76912.1 hypothetical protein GCM10011507_30310 [Edaphobacter acidisoli]